MPHTPMQKIDNRGIPENPQEIRAFVSVRNERPRLPCFLGHYRNLGVNRFFFADNLSTDGTVEFLRNQHDCHVFSAPGNYFAENVEPPRWTNALANVFGDGHWCLTVDADELFVYPHCDSVGLQAFCDYLEGSKSEAVAAAMIDMYAAGPVARTQYQQGKHFLDSCPYFDNKPGWIKTCDICPGWQMFGGVRERVFWRGRFKRMLPPCISKVPLVKWRKGMHYLISMHFHSGAKVSPITGALLHFKFLSGFSTRTSQQVELNKGIIEKGLEEQTIYLAALASRPDLTLMFEGSVRYAGPSQLVELGWMHSQPEFEDHVMRTSPERPFARARQHRNRADL